MSDPRRFAKQPLDYDELITKLTKKGLVIDDDAFAKQQLKRISYYRFVGYGLPFERYSNEGRRIGAYCPDTHFNQIINLYDNDVILRHH